MYEKTKTWNPFKGCRFDCKYCKPSFQNQAKRQKHNCIKCYNYEPHMHDERLNKIPKADLVFACGNGDIAFASDEEKKVILSVMEKHPKQTFRLGSHPDAIHIGAGRIGASSHHQMEIC